MANINFDQFELEIQRAENYLSQAPNRASTPQEDHETLFFASDISQAQKGAVDARATEDAVLSFGSAREAHDISENVDAPMYYDESLMHTLRFGASRDSDVQSEDRSTSHTGEPYRGNRETLFYASDVLPGGAASYGNDELSFQPSPESTPRDNAAHNRGNNYFTESLADTVRFTKPIEPAVRSMDQTAPLQNLSSSSRPPIVKSAIRKPAKSTAVTSTTTKDDDNDAPVPRKYVPRAQSPAKFTRRVPAAEAVETAPPKRAVSAMSMERIEELHRTRLVRQQEMLKQKRALDELQLAECTFKPDISKGSRTILHQKAQFEQLDSDLRHAGDENVDYDSLNGNVQTNPALHVSERLFREAEIRNAQNKWIKQQVNILRDSQFTYQPMINPSTTAPSSSGEHRPIHERIADMMKEKKQYMQTLRAAVEEEEVDLTFKPKIDARSRLIATQRLMGYGGNPNLPKPSRSTSATRQSAAQAPAPPSSGAVTAGQAAAPPTTAPGTTTGARSSAHTGGGGGGGMTGEQEAALVLGFHTDVASRLIDQGRAMAKRKQQLVHERDNELASAMEQVAISKRSERIVQAADLKGTFEERQAQYRERERKRQETLQKEQAQVTNSWFKPSIGAKSADIVSKHRPEILLESAEQKMERLSVKDAHDIEERRRRRAAELYGAIPFTPAIDPLSKMLGRTSSIEELMHNRRGAEVRERIRRRVEEEANQECTFHPQINELSKQLLEPCDEDLFLQQYNRDYAQVGWAQAGCPLAIDQSIRDSVQRAQNGRINMQEPELMARNIRLHLLEKEEKRRSELITREIDELKYCTFRPAIESSLASLERQRQDTSPVVIRGLGRYLELKHLTAKQKEDALQREKEVFSVKNVDKFRRPEDGSTMVQSFNFSLVEPRQHSRLDISSADEVVPGSLNASTIISHKSHRQATSPAALAAWCV